MQKWDKSGVSWDQVSEWLHNLEDEGYRVRVVLSRESHNQVRVSVTASVRGATGRWGEVWRRGEVVGSRDGSTVCKAAIRACAGVLADHERGERAARGEVAEYVQLPLPLEP